MTATLDNQVNTIWFHFKDAGIAIAIGLIVWLAVHYLIRGLVHRVKAAQPPWKSKGLAWAQPVLRTFNPVLKNLDTERRTQRAETIGSLLNSVLTVIIVVVVGFYVLLAFHVNLTPLLASVSVVGVSIGFGAQQLVRDFLAGIFITLEDQYGIGDVIQTSEVIGTVESVGLRITRVRSDDGTIWYLRNGEILRLGNRSQGDYVDPEAGPDNDDGGPAGLVDPTQPQPQKADG
ncbi:mechanosensitive ion channel protein MscS [Arthrobacter sp. ERGS1:01]|uniref:mechanosensitive ion channel family protein n=1 Tax=Arthrobacter sp. ERGS1:01 TaxID=1704044 RepID=UPI0006CB4713|nr:mechanosensitive ion channel domain-containing protein [Arthrobacter sp. ERGS1:01]ALE07807.1 mechanosensitive ion channel protein MscS [Arthrobacter sp. ERGS1:01]